MTPQTTVPTRIPGIGSLRLPVSRNDLLLLMVAMMQIGLGVETYLAHLISGDVKPAEAIPVFLGPIFGVILLGALGVRLSRRATTLSSLIILGVAAASVVVGVVGSAFHWARVVPPATAPGAALRWDWLIFAPPILGPLAFAGVGLLAIIAVLEDTQPESGKLTLPGIISFNTPLPQTRQFMWLIAFGLYAATLSSFLDHGRTSFENVFVWTPVVLGAFGAVATTLMALYANHKAADWFIFFWIMILMIVLGVMGLGLHVNADLPEGTANIVWERFIRGAPVMAPMLFALMGAFGLITMIGAETDEKPSSER